MRKKYKCDFCGRKVDEVNDDGACGKCAEESKPGRC
jgi:DNA-directed RNA polymerase subunit RPC12/RpoP